MQYNYKRYVGIPWESGGRDPNKSLDCWGIVWAIYTEVYDIDLPKLSHIEISNGYKETAGAVSEVFPEIYKNFDKVGSSEAPQEGDIIMLRIAGQPVHIGVVLSNRLMIHSSQKTNCTVEDFTTPFWNKRIQGIYRHKVFNK